MRVLGRITEWLIALAVAGALGILLGPWFVIQVFRVLIFLEG